MLLTKNQIERILNIVRRRNNLFVAKYIGHELLNDQELQELRSEYGEDAVSQIEDFVKTGYYAGYLRSKDLGSAPDIDLEGFKDEKKPFLNDFEEYSIEHHKEILDSYLQKLSQTTRTSFEQLVRSYNKAYKDHLMTNIALPLAIQAEEGERSVSELVTALRDATGDVARDWERVAITEIGNVLNTGMADKIVKMNPEKEASEIIVYKRVVNDARLCVSCRRLHLSDDGITPRIYTLAQALANGTNIGRKASEWRFTVGVIHSRCRCQLVQLPPGYWFNPKTGDLTYIGEGQAQELINDVLSV
jgi:hypothetical protein